MRKSTKSNFWMLTILTIFLMFFGALNNIVEGYQNIIKFIDTDDETETRFSIIVKSGGLLGADSCKGGYGHLRVVGEVPANISLADDDVAKSLITKGKNMATTACPAFHLGRGNLSIRLFKGTYPGKYSDSEVHAVWGQVYNRFREEAIRKGPTKYFNAALKRAKLAAEVTRTLSGNNLLFLLDTDKETSTKFWIYSRSSGAKCWAWTGGQMDIIGEVPTNISLLDDNMARSLVLKAAQFMLDKCNSKYNHVHVSLVYEGTKMSGGRGWSGKTQVFGKVDGGSRGNEWPRLSRYKNIALEANKKRLKEETQRAKEEKERKEALKRFNKFVKKNGVKEWPSTKKLSINPFIYEGKTVGLKLTFSQMLTATKGIFAEDIVVSKIPKRTFTRRVRVILAGRVLGNIAVKTQLGGEVLLPHLKFVGLYFCKYKTCSDLLGK